MAKQMKSKVKSMLIILSEIKGIAHKEFVLAGQTVISAYYYGLLRRLSENVRRLRQELWRQIQLVVSSRQGTVTFFTKEFLAKNNMTVVPNPPYSSLFLRLKIKLKCRHFDKTEVVEAESQDALKK
jgi:hypothetical protein